LDRLDALCEVWAVTPTVPEPALPGRTTPKTAEEQKQERSAEAEPPVEARR
jgi:hypothetical protein